MADSKISALTNGGGLQAGDALAVARSGASDRVSPIGVPVLVYRYTVTGSDKASIDTGVDTADAGSNDWTNGDLLEILLYARTDEVTVASIILATFNNDTTAGNYPGGAVRGQNTTASAIALSSAAVVLTAAGASATASVFSVGTIMVPNFAGTVGFKGVKTEWNIGDVPDGGNNLPYTAVGSHSWKSTSAITRLAVTPQTAGKKLKVGSQLLIYKRLSS